MKRYELVSHWHLAAPIVRVWDAIYEVSAWPRWWKYVLAVDELEKGLPSGVGAVRRFLWGSALPYQLSFTMRSTIVERPNLMEGEASGELMGLGRWTLTADGNTTHVQYDWQVETGRQWMSALAPVLAPVFRWNHGKVMAAGARGLSQFLGVKLLEG
jgi:Polyketide cyclase / dehydrase and lipid transport